MNLLQSACALRRPAAEAAFRRTGFFRRAIRGCLALLIVLAPVALRGQVQVPIPVNGAGQMTGVGATPLMSRKAPSASYFATFAVFNDGDYKNALEGFQASLRGAIKTLNARWLDSICYYTMIGESYYRLGKYPEAMDNYNAALRLYVQYADFMLRVQWPPSIQSAGASRGSAWGKSARGAQLGKFPDTIGMLVGTFAGRTNRERNQAWSNLSTAGTLSDQRARDSSMHVPGDDAPATIAGSIGDLRPVQR